MDEPSGDRHDRVVRDLARIEGAMETLDVRIKLLERVVYGGVGIVLAAFLALVLFRVGWGLH